MKNIGHFLLGLLSIFQKQPIVLYNLWNLIKHVLFSWVHFCCMRYGHYFIDCKGLVEMGITSLTANARLKLSNVVHSLFFLANFQLCGSRGGGNAAAKAVFWQARKGLSYTLAFETDRDRNAAIILARKFASNCNVCLVTVPRIWFFLWFWKAMRLTLFHDSMQVVLTGPGDQVHGGRWWANYQGWS